MSNATYFVQECPTCGRRLQVRVEYLGKSLVCQHCRGKFQARDGANKRAAPAAPLADEALLQRAEALLSSPDGMSEASLRPRPR